MRTALPQHRTPRLQPPAMRARLKGSIVGSFWGRGVGVSREALHCDLIKVHASCCCCSAGLHFCWIYSEVLRRKYCEMYIILYYVILYYIIIYHIILHYMISYHIILYDIMLSVAASNQEIRRPLMQGATDLKYKRKTLTLNS